MYSNETFLDLDDFLEVLLAIFRVERTLYFNVLFDEGDMNE